MIETGEPARAATGRWSSTRRPRTRVFAELEGCTTRARRFTAVSEERGDSRLRRRPSVLVVIDPIDGSLNAKRGLPHHALSVAVADGPTMADVASATSTTSDRARSGARGAARARSSTTGALATRRRRAPQPGRRAWSWSPSSRPTRAGWPSPPTTWSRAPRRIRAMGSIAVVDVPGRRRRASTPWRRWGARRAVDAAAAQLIVRESGGLVAFAAAPDPLGAPLDLEPHSPVVAARTPEALAGLRACRRSSGDRLARRARSARGRGRRPGASAPLPGDLDARAAAREQSRRVTGLCPRAPLPAAEAVKRARVDSTRTSHAMRPLLEPVAERLGGGAGALRGPLRGAAALLVGAEVGALIGIFAQRVLGQYELALHRPVGDPSPAVRGPESAPRPRATLEADEHELVTWVTSTRSPTPCSSPAAPWLREHLAGL